MGKQGEGRMELDGGYIEMEMGDGEGQAQSGGGRVWVDALV